MTLVDQAAARMVMARQLGREPLRWIADGAVARELPAGDELHGVPLGRGETRFGLELVCAAAG